jgi:hypothetical protein
MTSVHELKELKAQLAAHSRSLHELAASTRRLHKALAIAITSAQSRPTTPAPKPSRSGIFAGERCAEDQGQGQRSTALERRWGNLF